MTIQQELPSISNEIAQALQVFQSLVAHSRACALPSAKDRRVLELLSLWLELETEAARGACPIEEPA